MIRPLRSLHRLIWTLLALILPALVALALAHRHARPAGPLPTELSSAPPR